MENPEGKKPWNVRLEELATNVLNAAASVGAMLAAPVVFVLSPLTKVFTFVMGLLGIDYGSVDPFRLRRNGDTLLTPAVKTDLGVYDVLLGLTLSFELFAWGSMWSYVGETGLGGVWGVLIGVLLAALPFVFARMVILLDRGILVMDDPSGGKRTRVIVARASMLFLLALITAVPVELRVFAPEIDRVHADAEKAQVDAIREKAKAYETGLAEQQKATSADLVTGQPDDVVARRKEERAALVEQQRADRSEISRRLDKKGAEAARESSGHGVSGRRGAGTTTAVMRKQEAETRQELKEFDAAGREQLKEFDAETERMRSEAAGKGVDEIARRDTALAERLMAVEAMPAAELAAAYGGEYEVPNGFMARYRTLLTLVEEDGKNAAIAWGCRLVMIIMGLCVLFVKFVMTSPDTAAYFSMRSQALANNPDAVRHYIRLAKDTKASVEERDGATAVLRAVARDNAEAKAALESLGYTGNVEMAGWNHEVYVLHENLRAARLAAYEAQLAFVERFRQICGERVTMAGGFTAGVSRSELIRRGTIAWREMVERPFADLTNQERVVSTRGIQLPSWPSDLVDGDPRRCTRPWTLTDERLENEWGWVNPTAELYRRAPSA